MHDEVAANENLWLLLGGAPADLTPSVSKRCDDPSSPQVERHGSNSVCRRLTAAAGRRFLLHGTLLRGDVARGQSRGFVRVKKTVLDLKAP